MVSIDNSLDIQDFMRMAVNFDPVRTPKEFHISENDWEKLLDIVDFSELGSIYMFSTERYIIPCDKDPFMVLLNGEKVPLRKID